MQTATPAAYAASQQLRFKAVPGQSYLQSLNLVMATTVTAGRNQPSQSMRQEVNLRVKTDVTKVSRQGRITMRRRIVYLKQRQLFNGKVVSIFDSSRDRQRGGAHGGQEEIYLLAALESSWVLTMEPDGEIWDYAVKLPAKYRDRKLDMVVKSFLTMVIGLIDIRLPQRPVGTGKKWDCEDIDRMVPGLGRFEGTGRCNLDTFFNKGGESLAIISLVRSIRFRPDRDAAQSSEMVRCQEGGRIDFSLKRGRFIKAWLKGETVTRARQGGAVMTSTTTNELTLREEP